MNTDAIARRFQYLMPDGVRFMAQFPFFPWQDEAGNWYEPAQDDLIIRVQTAGYYANAMIKESDLSLTDQLFSARILEPMLSALEREVAEVSGFSQNQRLR